MEIIRTEPRRRWPLDAKLAAVVQTFQPGETVNGVARRLGANASMLFTWRKQYREQLGFPLDAPRIAFRPVAMIDPPAVDMPLPAAAGGAIDIAFDGDIHMRITGAVDPALAAALAKALTRR